MPRRPTRQAVDELLAQYEQAHHELTLELDAELARLVGTTGRAQFLSDRLGVIEIMIERFRTGIDPITGEVRLTGPGWQGLVGPDLTNGLSAEIAHQAYASGIVISETVLDAQGAPASPRMASLHEQAATLLAEELTEKTDENLTGVLRSTRDLFREIQAKSTVAGMTKGENVGDLVTRLVNNFRDQGFKSFPTRRLKKDGTPVEWSLEAYARMLARTLANKGSQRAHDNRAAEYGLDLVIVVGGIGTATCETCIKALNPEREPGEDPRPIYSRSGESDKWPPLQPLFDAKPPLGHPNCLLPGTRVVAPDLFTVTCAWYVGDAVELLLASGTRLSVTPNHVLLGPRGWVRVGELGEGDDVIYCPGLEGIDQANPHDNQMPPLVEDVFAAAVMTNGMTTVSVPVSPEDLHGDGSFVQGQIDVVAAQSLLRSGRPARAGQGLAYEFLQPRASDALTFAGQSDLTPMFMRLALAADSGVGGIRDLPASFWAERLEVHPHLFTRAAALNPPLLDPVVDSALRNAEMPLEVLDAVPGGVEFGKLVSVNRYPVETHVYDLHSLSTLYACNGVLSSNCGHQWLPYTETSRATDEEIDALAQEVARRMGAERLMQEDNELMAAGGA